MKRSVWLDTANPHFDFVVADFIVDFGEIGSWKILTIIDATIHLDVLFFGHLMLYLMVKMLAIYSDSFKQ